MLIQPSGIWFGEQLAGGFSGAIENDASNELPISVSLEGSVTRREHGLLLFLLQQALPLLRGHLQTATVQLQPHTHRNTEMFFTVLKLKLEQSRHPSKSSRSWMRHTDCWRTDDATA